MSETTASNIEFAKPIIFKPICTPKSKKKYYQQDNMFHIPPKAKSANLFQGNNSLAFYSDAEIVQDFLLIREKSDLFDSKEELLSILSRSNTIISYQQDDEYYDPIERVQNPLYKNLEQDE